MFRLGWPELVIVTAIISVLLIWRLPQVERSLERGLKNIPANRQRWLRATGYPILEAFLVLLISMGAAVAIGIPVLRWLCR